MPPQKIVKFQGKNFFQCLHSGALLERAYALPERDARNRRRNGGSFSDAACAIAWLEKQRDLGKVSYKKYERLMEDIRRELIPDRPSLQLVSAPEMDPESPDFSYRKEYPWVHQEDLYLTVSQVLDWRSEGKEGKGEKEPKPYFYQFLSTGDHYPLDHDQFPMPINSLVCVNKGRVLLRDQDQKQGLNPHLEALDLPCIPGDFILISSKKLGRKRKRNGEGEPKARKSRCL
jgi:hypothetical protein